jgi:glycosyltransferase involved in cell wall biosynthesis
MSLVTLTDHDTIAGGLELVDRPDFFLSEEVTAIFPESGCVMHVLAWNITPAQHEEIQARRRDIYRLCEYLNREAIAHALAHPLLSPSWQLDVETLEKLILLFPAFESINGLTDRRIEPDLAMLLERLTPEVIEALASKHDLRAHGATPHKKALTAGSDDHVHRRCGTVFVEVDGAGLAPAEMLARCMAGEAQLRGRQAHLNTMAMCVKHTTYHHLKQRQAARVDFRNPFVEMMDLLAGRDPNGGGGEAPAAAYGFVASLLDGVQRASLEIGKPFDILEIPENPTEEDDDRVVEAIARLSDKVLEQALGGILAGAQDFDLYRIFGALRDVVGGLVTAGPLFFAADHFGKQEQQVRRVWERWTAFPVPPRAERLAVFTDSLAQVDGVSTWCKRFVESAHTAGRDVLIPYCGELPDHVTRESPEACFHRVAAVTGFAPPLYSQIRLYVPSLIDVLEWMWRERITRVELATPGPMGLAALLVAKVLRLPVTASYHTEVPALLKSLGGNALMEKSARRYLAWFYARVDRVFAFSTGSRDALVQMGVRPEKLSVMPVAVDPRAFSPDHRSSSVFRGLNVDVGDRPVVLSVGRISEEKNLPVVIEAVERLQSRRPQPILLVVGDGPERDELERRYRGRPFVRFLGLQCGDTLKKLYASARLFVFASRVDTLGLVNLEAMCSGVPVLVPSDACIADSVINGVSADCYEFGVEGLARAVARVLDDPRRAERLGAGAREAMIQRWKRASFSEIWKNLTQQA